MVDDRKSLAERYLARLRGRDEATALRRVRATDADLRVWRRDPVFREAERAARLAPRVPARVINLNNISTFKEDAHELALLRRRRDAGHASADDLRRLRELEKAELRKLGR